MASLSPSVIQKVRRGYPVPEPLTNDQRLQEFMRKLASMRSVQFNPYFLAGRNPRCRFIDDPLHEKMT